MSKIIINYPSSIDLTEFKKRSQMLLSMDCLQM